MGQQTVVFVPVGYALTLTAVSAGSYFIPGNPGDEPSGYAALDAAASIVLGPFNTPRSYSLQSDNNDMAYSLAYSGVFSSDDGSAYATLASPTFTGTVVLPATTSIDVVSGTEIGYLNGASSNIQAQIDSLTVSTLGYTTTATAAGTTTLTAASTAQQFFTGVTTQNVVLPVTSTLILGHQYRIVNDSTGAVTVKSSGANNIVVLPANTVAILTCILITGTSAASWDYTDVPNASGITGTGDLVRAVGPTLTGTVVLPSTTSIGNVSDVEIGYLDNVTSAIQTQLDAKAASLGADDNYVTDAEKLVIGNTSGTNSGDNATNSQYSGLAASKQDVVSGVDDTEIGYLNGVTSALQTQLDAKQAIVSGVSDTEIGYLDGVTSAIQTQMNLKAPLANPTFSTGVTVSNGGFTSGSATGGVIGSIDLYAVTANKGYFELVGRDNAANYYVQVQNASHGQSSAYTIPDTGLTSDQFVMKAANDTALGLKAPLASPTFTGTVALPVVTVVKGTPGTESANAVTVNGSAGVITTSSLTTAASSSYVITLTNSSIVDANSVILVSAAGGTNTTKDFSLEAICTAAGTATITIYNNVLVTTALNGTIIMNFMVV